MAKKSFRLPSIHSQLLTIVVSLLFAIIFNLRIEVTYLSSFPINDFGTSMEALAFTTFVFSLLWIFFSSINFRYLQKIIIIIAFLTSASALYFSLQFNTLFDESMLNNALETNTSEAADLLNQSFWMMFILLGIFPSFVIYKLPVRYPKLLKNTGLNILSIAAACLLLVTVIAPNYRDFSSFVRNHNVKLKNSLLPYAPVHSLYKTVSARFFASPIAEKQFDTSAKIISPPSGEKRKSLLIVIVVGETARESSFGRVKREYDNRSGFLTDEAELVYLDNVWSCGTNTAASLPCMFSTFGKEQFQRDYNQKYENIAELMQRVGYDVTWRDNNSGCKGICDNLKLQPVTLNETNSKAGLYHDEILLDNFNDRITTSGKDQILFLHQMGSHGPAYFKRTPRQYKKYLPECSSEDFAECKPQEIVNAYDNTIIYTNHVLAQTINKLKQLSNQFDTALIYLSDHGESTGESGYYLHGIPYFMAPDEQIHIPMLLWFSKGLANSKKIDMACLQAQRHQRFSHDNFSHTLLGLLDIQTKNYDGQLDLIADCKI